MADSSKNPQSAIGRADYRKPRRGCKEVGQIFEQMASHTTTLAHEYARQGRDWEAELRQRAKETALMRELGLTAAAGSAARCR